MPFRYSMSSFIPFRDAEACARVRAIRRADLARHRNAITPSYGQGRLFTSPFPRTAVR
jgi:hypothetical protein